MGSNRTYLVIALSVIFLAGVYYLATLRPLVSTSVIPDLPTSTATTPAAESESSASSEDETADVSQAGSQTQEAPEEPEVGDEPESSASTARQNSTGSESVTSADDQADGTVESIENFPPVTFYTYGVIKSYPHDPRAFTQGLIWHEGQLYEGTGIREQSSLRKVNLEDGEVIQQINLQDDYFGEGITIFGDRIYQLTWQSNIGFIYDLNTFEELESFEYPTEGWGITHDGEQLIMSDGSTQLFFWDPETLEEIRSVEVTLRGEPVERLNELEYIDGLVYANIWQTNWIAQIDPETGVIRGMINLDGLLQVPAGHTLPVDVLNGIAYDDATGRLFVTGKLWPELYEIELIEDANIGILNQ